MEQSLRPKETQGATPCEVILIRDRLTSATLRSGVIWIPQNEYVQPNEHFLQWILNIVSFLALLVFFISIIYCTWVLLPMLRGEAWIHKVFRVLFICWWAWLQGGLVLLAGDQCNSIDVVLGSGSHGTHIYILTLYNDPGNALASSQRKIFCSYFLINIISIEQHKWIFKIFLPLLLKLLILNINC